MAKRTHTLSLLMREPTPSLHDSPPQLTALEHLDSLETSVRKKLESAGVKLPKRGKVIPEDFPPPKALPMYAMLLGALLRLRGSLQKTFTERTLDNSNGEYQLAITEAIIVGELAQRLQWEYRFKSALAHAAPFYQKEESYKINNTIFSLREGGKTWEYISSEIKKIHNVDLKPKSVYRRYNRENKRRKSFAKG